ncbi:MAG TPA: DUF711 family protein [Anaerolineales bacterium]|nr:DUF711 family protein [Anaerolineales bacterium]
MKIRSITVFLNPRWPSPQEALARAGAFITAARPAFESAGYEVQTSRLATVPFQQLGASWVQAGAVGQAQVLEKEALAHGFDYLSLGPATPVAPGSYAVIPEMLASTTIVFLSGVMALPGAGLSLPGVRACAEIIHRVAGLDPNGFANLRFAALANVPPGSPFFPASYHVGNEPAFALATEAADLAVTAFDGASSLEQARQRLVAALDYHGRALLGVAEPLAGKFGLEFGGIDFSLAPFPQEAHSLGTAFERLGLPAVGMHGSLAAAAFLADTIDRADFPRAGFSGLMLPVLEDSVLAQRAAQGLLGVNDLLLYSAVCGTGLDTVPLPGDTSVEQLQAVLLDVAALAQRLEKPLTARLMPVPGKAAGDPTGFDFPYFANSRVLALNAQPLSGLLAGEETIALQRRK